MTLERARLPLKRLPLSPPPRPNGSGGGMTTLDWALLYLSRGWTVVPVRHRSKKPIHDDWPNLRIGPTEAPQHFGGRPMNIGVALGPSSGGLVDVDLDCVEAVRLAPFLLPRTRAVFGRPSNRGSHYLFTAPELSEAVGAKEAWTDPAPALDPITGEKANPKLLELRVGGRGKAAQTVAPGSTHKETGELIAWEENGDPAKVDGGMLRRAVRALAAGCLLVKAWR